MEEKTEVWKSLDFMGYPDYEVSNWGRVKSLTRKGTYDRILKPFPRGKYYSVDLYKDGKRKSFNTHRLVASAFIPNSYNLSQINHKDENKQNNKVENLEWCDNYYNLHYGTCQERRSKSMKGKNKGKILPTRKPILQFTLEGIFIREWDSAKQASEELNVCASGITQCCKEKRKTCGGYIWKYKESI